MKNDEYISHNLRYLSEGYILLEDYKKAESLLQYSLKSIRVVKNTMRKTIYESVIYSHLGVLSYIQKDYKKSREYFLAGLTSDKKYPLVRGTYTWLNKLGLALSFKKLGFKDEANQLLLLSQKQRKQLGIEKSFQTINVYSAALAKDML
jgi:tetratricopeptide (TPR) repeat protein